MGIKRYVSFLLSLVLIITAVNIGYAENKSIDNSNTEIEIPDKVLSDSSVEENTESSSETTTTTSTETTTETTTETSTETTTTYTVRFDSNGGSDVESITVVGGSKIGELPVPVKEGYAFKGWFRDCYTFEKQFTSDDIVDSNLRLYAKWNELIKLTFDSNGGSAVEPVYVEPGATTILPKNITKDGCTFGGWYLDELWSDEYTDTTAAPEYNRILFAKWIKALPTESEIKDKYNKLNFNSVSNKFIELPQISAPYSTGKLSSEFVSTGLDYLNFIRYVEGLNEVSLDESKIDLAQHGAVLMAALSNLSHTPSKPQDMEQDFYELGYQATITSNIAWTSYSVNNLKEFVDMWIKDDDIYNMSSLGHRRWLLNPEMLYTAFGYVNGFDGDYSNVISFDDSNEDMNFYDYIAYPVQGNFPKNIINNNTPWSISLNKNLYNVASVDDVNIKITKVSNGKVWNISNKDHTSTPSMSEKYFNYKDANFTNYGSTRCIIFNIGSRNISDNELNGKFDVEVTGLKDKNGNDTSINYTVNLFDLSTSGSGSSSGGSTSGGGSSSGGSSSGGSSGGGGGGGGGGSSTTYYIINFDSNGGNAVDSKKVISNSKLTKPSEPIKKGYEFTGWYTDNACTKLYDFKSKVTKSFTLYAGWKAVDNIDIEKEKEEITQKTGNVDVISNVVRVIIGNNLFTVGNKIYAMDVTPYIQPESNSTLVPLRFAAIAISGGDIENADSSSIVDWDANTKTASITAGGKVIKFTAGSELMYIGNTPTVMENGVKAEIKDGRMFIPFRALGKALGVKVDWDADTKTAIYSVE